MDLREMKEMNEIKEGKSRSKGTIDIGLSLLYTFLMKID